jgi:hypothetical protein
MGAGDPFSRTRIHDTEARSSAHKRRRKTMSRSALNSPQQQIRDLVSSGAPLHQRAAAAFRMSEAQEISRSQEKCIQLAKRILGVSVDEWSDKLADAKGTPSYMRPSQLVAFEQDGFLFNYQVTRKGGESVLCIVEFCMECGNSWKPARYIDSLSDLGAYEAHPSHAFVCDDCKKAPEETAA